MEDVYWRTLRTTRALAPGAGSARRRVAVQPLVLEEVRIGLERPGPVRAVAPTRSSATFVHFASAGVPLSVYTNQIVWSPASCSIRSGEPLAGRTRRTWSA